MLPTPNTESGPPEYEYKISSVFNLFWFLDKNWTNLLDGGFVDIFLSSKAVVLKYIGFDNGKLVPVKKLNIPPTLPLAAASLVSKVGFIPCLSKCPPIGFNAACAKVEVGKYTPLFNGNLLFLTLVLPAVAFILTPVLDSTSCLAVNKSPFGDF